MVTRRIKTYTAQTGYVYEYYFVGKRPASVHAGIEYVFEASKDRTSFFSLSVILLDAATGEWEAAHGRTLSDPEQFAAAKLRLQQAFDEGSTLQEHTPALLIDSACIEELLAPLDL